MAVKLSSSCLAILTAAREDADGDQLTFSPTRKRWQRSFTPRPSSYVEHETKRVHHLEAKRTEEERENAHRTPLAQWHDVACKLLAKAEASQAHLGRSRNAFYI